MKVKDVLILKEASDDLNEGKAFYDIQEPGVGDYFWDCMISDIESLNHLCRHSRKTARFL